MSRTQISILTGTIPQEIGFLRELYFLGAESSGITGRIPVDILMNMSSLQTLQLMRNKFIGGVSRDFSNLTMLTSLDLTENYLTGTIIHLFNLMLPMNIYIGRVETT